MCDAIEIITPDSSTQPQLWGEEMIIKKNPHSYSFF